MIQNYIFFRESCGQLESLIMLIGVSAPPANIDALDKVRIEKKVSKSGKQSELRSN